MVSDRLADRVALVTGAAGGIGRGIAARLLAEGAVVVVNDLDPDACAVAVADLGAGAVAAPGDVTDPASATAVLARVGADHGRLDILVNNAGVTRDGPLHRMSDEDWRVVHDVGLRGAFNLCRAAAPLLRAPADHHRKVINISSNVALHGAPGTANYSAAKAGLIGLTRALAREWASRRVNVNALAPGLIEGTGLTAAKPAELIARVAEQVPLGRAGTPADVGAAVAFLASADADYMTGQVLELSGGLEVPV
ncbi:MAG TPA: SDR family oxidoreductase [Baekduia sp.]|uniref:SDR family oxidoreductase n=1 Tax=Baekduia sp. TaxID=2600305 RepID=UPI002D7A1554|nr:SDR family oxidoreductase [Baekduia sp.]HET6507027.1 SDR family oxidoreductase [Baekduia sp.]